MLVLEPKIGEVGALGAALTESFEAAREALVEGEAVVFVIADGDLYGAGGTAAAALAGGLVGLARALALEGRKPGWRVAALALEGEPEPEERRRWLDALAGSDLASGSLLRLGGGQLGKVPL
jgi:NAD(P)-dependent dehydrogenase (short-subunit alcohol dehydrogenase family)